MLAPLLCGTAAAGTAARPLHVLAPWCLEKRLRRVVEIFQEQRPATPVRIRTGTPGLLIRQVKDGARPHVYIAMGPAEIEVLDSLGLVQRGSPTEILKQTLVLAVAAPAQDTVRGLRDLARKDVEAVGIGRPTLTSGRLTRAALARLGLLDAVEPKAKTSPLRSLVLGTVPAAVLYEQCAYEEDLYVGRLAPRRGLARVHPLPPALCEPFPVLAAALRTDPAHPAASIFLRVLTEKRAQDILHRRGEWSCPICEMEP